MKLTANINLGFNGNCEAAFEFYERCLGARIAGLFRYANSPMATHVPPEWGEKIMHATLAIGDTIINGADAPPERYVEPQGFEVMIGTDDIEYAERAFAALAENGTVHWPLQETFWAARFGVLVDQFGLRWSINCEQPPAAQG